MEYFVEQATSHSEAVDRLRRKYGDNFRILSQKSVRLGGFLGLFAKEGIEITGYLAKETGRPRAIDMEEEKKKFLAMSRANDPTMEKILTELSAIKQKVEEQPTVAVSAEAAKHPSLQRLEELLETNEFSRTFIRDCVARARKECTVDQLDDFDTLSGLVVQWIAEGMQIAPQPRTVTTPRIVILVGPTGVGKTTTIAKLAAMFGVHGSPKRREVRILTIDNYRIGAQQQIETYGEIMEIPVHCVQSADDLKKQLAIYHDVDMIFIDTIGKSPKDFQKLGEMRSLLNACAQTSETHLVMSATTKLRDMHQISRQFEPFGYQSIIFTKLDETDTVGSCISLVTEKRKPLAYLTTGQRVPQDIEPARITGLLFRLEGFKIDRDSLEERYSGRR